LSLNGIEITLPRWLEKLTKKMPVVYPTIEDRMRAVISLSQLNIDNHTGGPFAAGVFES
jgi:hypothetical protein